VSSKGCFFKQEKDDKVWWYDKFDTTGEMLFSFDRKKLYNLFRDYPWKLSVTEWLTFNRENEFWENFFEVRNSEYREAHAEDIEKHLKAVETYRIRRDGRVKSRMDDGNTKLPFGLCEREGIEVGEDWKPKDAWDALAKKGITPSDAYKEADKTEKPKTEKVKTKMSEEHFPSSMLEKAYRKNTMEFANYINEHCKDHDVAELLCSAMGKGGKIPSDIKCVREKGAGSGILTYFDHFTRVPTKIEVHIPNFAGIKDEKIKAQKMREFAHEWTHLVDEFARDRDRFSHFSDTYDEVQDAIKEDDGSIGEDVKKLFDEFNAKFDETLDRQKKDKTKALLDMAAREYGEIPEWIRRDDGGIDYLKAWSNGLPTKTIKEYEKKGRRLEKELHEKGIGERWSIMDGVANLQGIYDSINSGKLRANKTTRLGHSERYFFDENNKAVEALADYVALKVTSPELIELFRKDKPKIAKALDNEIVEITKRMRNGRD
jgi:hypothetical protein